MALIGRGILYVCLLIWTWRFVSQPMGTAAMSSVLHGVNREDLIYLFRSRSLVVPQRKNRVILAADASRPTAAIRMTRAT